MAQDITLHVAEMVAAAEREIETLQVADAIKLHGVDETCATFANSTARGAFRVRSIAHVACWNFGSTRPAKYHKPVFAAEKKFVFFCAGGARSALAAQTAQRMGLKPVAHIGGGFGAWREAGGPVDMRDAAQKGS